MSFCSEFCILDTVINMELLDMERTIEDYAKAGEQHDIMDALTLLTKAFISMCGLSLSYRSVVYRAAERWQDRLGWLDLPLSETARKSVFAELMPIIDNGIDYNYLEKYDITVMDNEELVSCCKQMIDEDTFDQATTEVICWGIQKTVDDYLSEGTQEVEAVAPDGTLLKGYVTLQECNCTSINMVAPFKDGVFLKYELIRNPQELLLEGYKEYQRLHSMEAEIRRLYPKYQEELAKVKKENRSMKNKVFFDVYDELIGDSVLILPRFLFQDWFDLNFIDTDS